jgi:hypothetical protein
VGRSLPPWLLLSQRNAGPYPVPERHCQGILRRSVSTTLPRTNCYTQPKPGCCNNTITIIASSASCNLVLRENLSCSASSDCGSCPLGYLCYPGNPVPQACPKGFYCSVSQAVVPCQAGTYNPLVAQYNNTACVACPPGYECSNTGIGDLTPYACPVSKYCLTGTATAVSCPATTFRNYTGARNVSECEFPVLAAMLLSQPFDPLGH